MFRSSHSLTVGNAKVTLEEGLRAIAGGETEIDLSDVVAVDSAAVATLLAWQGAALNQGHSLHFSSLPANLESLIDLALEREHKFPGCRRHTASLSPLFFFLASLPGLSLFPGLRSKNRI